jgi:hypothetical protein
MHPISRIGISYEINMVDELYKVGQKR